MNLHSHEIYQEPEQDLTFTQVLEFSLALQLSSSELLSRIFSNKVLVLRNCPADSETYVHFMKKFGRLVPHVLEQFCLPGYRDVLTISNLYRNGLPIGVHEGGAYWHTDMSYRQENQLLTALKAVRVPKQGGQTFFLDCVKGYQELQKTIKAGRFKLFPEIDELEAVVVEHRFGNRELYRNQNAKIQTIDTRQKRDLGEAVFHPLIYSHQVTQQKSIYGVAGSSMKIRGLSAKQSQVILDQLFDFILEHSPRYTHHYKTHDLVIWDNLSTLHCGPEIGPSNDEEDCRILHRINVLFHNSL